MTLFRISLFGAAHGWEGAKTPLLPKICQTYPAMMKLGTVVPYRRKIQKMYKSRLTFFYFLKIVLISMVTILMMSAKMGTLCLLKIKVFWYEIYNVIIFPMTSPTKLFYVTQIILQKWSCNQKFGNSSISMREVIITSILYKFDQKKHIFEGWSWFKSEMFKSLRLHLFAHSSLIGLKFKTTNAKRYKIKSKGYITDWDIAEMLSNRFKRKSLLKYIFLNILAFFLAKIYLLTFCSVNRYRLKGRWYFFAYICPVILKIAKNIFREYQKN